MQWSRILRRSVAFFLAVVTLWVLTLTGDMGAAADRLTRLGESAQFVEAALSAELGAPPPSAGPLANLSLLDNLVLGQSARLKGGRDEVADFLAAQDAETSPTPDVAVTPAPTPTPILPVLTGTGAGPQILIVHTHTTEAYSPTAETPYAESDSYRTTDPHFNVVAVGDALAEAYGVAGFTVLHDREIYDYPKYSGAYTRSSAAVTAYLKEYPSIKVVFDVHRDAIYNTDGSVACTADGGPEGSARVLVVVGSNQKGLHPNFAQNRAFAETLQVGLDRDAPKLCRGVDLRASHYYQQLSPGSLLLEVGSHGDTLASAVTAAKAFGAATGGTIGDYLKNLPPEGSPQPVTK
ncbi:MAG: stage II sporulation protein P [Oscillospiraceae bacterium]